MKKKIELSLRKKDLREVWQRAMFDQRNRLKEVYFFVQNFHLDLQRDLLEYHILRQQIGENKTTTKRV